MAHFHENNNAPGPAGSGAFFLVGTAEHGAFVILTRAVRTAEYVTAHIAEVDISRQDDKRSVHLKVLTK